jgi:DNA ligase-1
MDSLINCIYSIAQSRGQSMEAFMNEITVESLFKKIPPQLLGTSGKPVYPENTKTTSDSEYTHVPGLKDHFMLANKYTKDLIISKRSSDYSIMQANSIPQPPIGWYMSEKFDGQRALWDGQKFVTRGSASSLPRVYPYVPVWIIALMPPGIALDGEFFTKRNSFQEIGFLRSKLKPEKERKKGDKQQIDLDKKWNSIIYQAFDLISDEPFEKRQERLQKIISERSQIWNKIDLPPYLKKGDCPLVLTKQYRIESEAQMNEYYTDLVSHDAEGVMIRAPKCPYIPKRTSLMLKIKPEEDSECIIIGYKPGEGKYSGMLGAFKCNDSGKIFFVGGMDYTIRANYHKTHPIGTKITYKYTFLTDDGIPRHPRYKGIPGDR